PQPEPTTRGTATIAAIDHAATTRNTLWPAWRGRSPLTKSCANVRAVNKGEGSNETCGLPTNTTAHHTAITPIAAYRYGNRFAKCVSKRAVSPRAFEPAGTKALVIAQQTRSPDFLQSLFSETRFNLRIVSLF